MLAWIKLAISRVLDVGEVETPSGRALLQVQYRALQRQIPLLYLIALSSMLGVHLGRGLSYETLAHPANFIVALVVVRLAHWVRTRNRELSPTRIVSELRMTLALAAVLSSAAGFWAISLIASEAPQQQDLVILFASLAAIGTAYGLSSFPAAGRLPLTLFALPFSITLGFSPRPAHMAVGVILGLISLISLRLLKLQNKGLVELVRSRTEVESERERAQRAERATLIEHERVKQVANTDSLTGLANRRAFLSALETRLQAPPNQRFAVALMDLDGFKPINDIFGHATGDALLAQVAARLRGDSQDRNFVARIGGDEFGVIISRTDSKRIMQVARRLVRSIGRPYHIEGREFRISACCGVVKVTSQETDLTATLRNGDIALYQGKQAGRGCVALFTPELDRANRRRLEIERALRDPAALGNIRAVFQPIFDLELGALKAFEALARWRHPRLGEISPREFIPIAEQSSIIEDLTEILLDKSAREVSRWPPAICLSFNLSAVQICSPNSALRILSVLRRAGLDPARVWFEVTETALLADFVTARVNLNALREAGARIALDDFGAGYASISYLREIAFDAVKLDGSLVTGAVNSARAAQLLQGVLKLCASIGVACVAEHIETREQLKLLVGMGCQSGQGLALSPALEASVAASTAEAIVAPKPPVARFSGNGLARVKAKARRMGAAA